MLIKMGQGMVVIMLTTVGLRLVLCCVDYVDYSGTRHGHIGSVGQPIVH